MAKLQIKTNCWFLFQLSVAFIIQACSNQKVGSRFNSLVKNIDLNNLILRTLNTKQENNSNTAAIRNFNQIISQNKLLYDKILLDSMQSIGNTPSCSWTKSQKELLGFGLIDSKVISKNRHLKADNKKSISKERTLNSKQNNLIEASVSTGNVKEQNIPRQCTFLNENNQNYIEKFLQNSIFYNDLLKFTKDRKKLGFLKMSCIFGNYLTRFENLKPIPPVHISNRFEIYSKQSQIIDIFLQNAKFLENLAKSEPFRFWSKSQLSLLNPILLPSLSESRLKSLILTKPKEVCSDYFIENKNATNISFKLNMTTKTQNDSIENDDGRIFNRINTDDPFFNMSKNIQNNSSSDIKNQGSDQINQNNEFLNGPNKNIYSGNNSQTNNQNSFFNPINQNDNFSNKTDKRRNNKTYLNTSDKLINSNSYSQTNIDNSENDQINSDDSFSNKSSKTKNSKHKEQIISNQIEKTDDKFTFQDKKRDELERLQDIIPSLNSTYQRDKNNSNKNELLNYQSNNFEKLIAKILNEAENNSQQLSVIQKEISNLKKDSEKSHFDLSKKLLESSILKNQDSKNNQQVSDSLIQNLDVKFTQKNTKLLNLVSSKMGIFEEKFSLLDFSLKKLFQMVSGSIYNEIQIESKLKKIQDSIDNSIDIKNNDVSRYHGPTDVQFNNWLKNKSNSNNSKTINGVNSQKPNQFNSNYTISDKNGNFGFDYGNIELNKLYGLLKEIKKTTEKNDVQLQEVIRLKNNKKNANWLPGNLPVGTNFDGQNEQINENGVNNNLNEDFDEDKIPIIGKFANESKNNIKKKQSILLKLTLLENELSLLENDRVKKEKFNMTNPQNEIEQKKQNFTEKNANFDIKNKAILLQLKKVLQEIKLNFEGEISAVETLKTKDNSGIKSQEFKEIKRLLRKIIALLGDKNDREFNTIDDKNNTSTKNTTFSDIKNRQTVCLRKITKNIAEAAHLASDFKVIPFYVCHDCPNKPQQSDKFEIEFDANEKTPTSKVNKTTKFDKFSDENQKSSKKNTSSKIFSTSEVGNFEDILKEINRKNHKHAKSINLHVKNKSIKSSTFQKKQSTNSVSTNSEINNFENTLSNLEIKNQSELKLQYQSDGFVRGGLDGFNEVFGLSTNTKNLKEIDSKYYQNSIQKKSTFTKIKNDPISKKSLKTNFSKKKWSFLSSMKKDEK